MMYFDWSQPITSMHIIIMFGLLLGVFMLIYSVPLLTIYWDDIMYWIERMIKKTKTKRLKKK